MNTRPSARLLRLPLAAALAAAAVAPAAAATTLLRVDLRAAAVRGAGPVLLQDVAWLSSPDLALLRRAMAVPLGQAPRAGQTVTLDLERLRPWLLRQLALPDGLVEWRGAPEVQVAASAQTLRASELVAAAEQALRQHLGTLLRQAGLDDPQVGLQATQPPPDLQIPEGVPELRVRALAQQPLAPRMVVWLDVYGDGRFVRSLPVRFDVAAPVLPVASAAPGTRPAPLVARGDRVLLVAQAGLVTLERPVEVLQDGALGQTVRVRPGGASGQVLARVTGPGRVELAP